MRISCLGKLDQCLHSFLELKVTDAVHYTCRSIWNAGGLNLRRIWILFPAVQCIFSMLNLQDYLSLGLPLLFTNLKHHATSSFSSASKALASIESPLHKLRILLHLETSKLYLDRGYIKDVSFPYC